MPRHVASNRQHLPFCRIVFFDAQPQPHTENSITNGSRLASGSKTGTSLVTREGLAPPCFPIGAMGAGGWAPIRGFEEGESVAVFVAAVGLAVSLDPQILDLAEAMAEEYAGSEDDQGFSTRRIAAVSIDLASHVLRRHMRGRCPAPTGISWAAGTIMEDSVRVHRHMYPVRDWLISDQNLERRGRGNFNETRNGLGFVY